MESACVTASTSSSLLKPIPFNSYSHLQSPRWSFLPPIPSSTKKNIFTIKTSYFTRRDSTLILKCNMKEVDFDYRVEKIDNPNPFTYEGVVEVIMKGLKSLQKPGIIILIVLGFILLYRTPRASLALSGGSMGGDSFSSSSDSSSSYDFSSDDTSSDTPTSVEDVLHVICGFFGFIILCAMISRAANFEHTSIIKLQVCLFGATTSLQKDLDRIAESANTSNPTGWNYILKETAKALLHRPDYCISAHSSVGVKESPIEVETLFRRLSIEERGKFDKETLVNLNNTKWKGTSRDSGKELSSDYIVVTVLLAAKGTHMLPSTRSNADLKIALEKLRLISTEKTTAVQVLWAPQEDND